MSDRGQFEQSYLRPALAAALLRHLGRRRPRLPVPVQAVQVERGADHGGLVQVHGRGGGEGGVLRPGLRVDQLAVVQLQVAAAQRVVAVGLAHLALPEVPRVGGAGVAQLEVALLVLAPGAHHVPLELGEAGRRAHLHRVPVLAHGRRAAVRGAARGLRVLRLELRGDHACTHRWLPGQT